MAAYPNFLCVGQQKAGTQWLYDQLNACDQFWCTPIKELNYFSDNFLKTGNLKRIYASANGLDGKGNKLGEKDISFYKHVSEFKDGKPNSFEEYQSLFSFADGKISGDISPSYATLTEAEIQVVKKNCGHLNIVMFIRHPVDRAVSAFNMHIRHGKIASDVATNRSVAKQLIARSTYEERAYASQIWTKWHNAFPSASRYWFLEDIIQEPEKTRNDITAFLGAEKPIFTIPASTNVKKEREKITFSNDVIDFLYEYYSKEIEDCKNLFGRHALEWRTRRAG